MVACAAERIVALPSAVVGSIGVVSARPMVEALLHKMGVEMLVAKTGLYKDMGSPFREATPEERAKEQALLDAIYTRFPGDRRGGAAPSQPGTDPRAGDGGDLLGQPGQGGRPD